MTDDKPSAKPREFWITKEFFCVNPKKYMGAWDVKPIYGNERWNNQAAYFHAIEYSAYEAEKNRADSYRTAMIKRENENQALRAKIYGKQIFEDLYEMVATTEKLSDELDSNLVTEIKRGQKWLDKHIPVNKGKLKV